ncbi:MAG: MBL fold metallo-hydrolase [Desulfobacterales bacterium]|nr:MBL fold metallo-hydrolase [Desulfobacterales bacterium]MCP4158511.1 MBL fold metallo-hydrolase [Deltaproteobacteria bacterium]
MKIHHIRNATFVIESDSYHILIDPMLSQKGVLPPFARFKHKPRKNPMVSLPDNASDILNKVTNCLITHSQKFGIKALQHTDHLDKAGELFLKNKKIPVVTHEQDSSYLKKHGFNIEISLKYWQKTEQFGGSIIAIPALHGHKWINKFMANGAGFFIELPDEPSIYISGDTVYTNDVEKVLLEFKPDIAVMASGCASLDIGGPILMPHDELITFVRNAPGKVIANHIETLNHCPTTRLQLKNILENKGLLSKVLIPDDGETLTINK